MIIWLWYDYRYDGKLSTAEDSFKSYQNVRKRIVIINNNTSLSCAKADEVRHALYIRFLQTVNRYL